MRVVAFAWPKCGRSRLPVFSSTSCWCPAPTTGATVTTSSRAGGQQSTYASLSEEALLARLHSLPGTEGHLTALSDRIAATKDKGERLAGLVDLRASLLATRHDEAREEGVRDELRAIAGGLREVLAERFDPHTLTLRSIEPTSSAAIFGKVVEAESVHPLKSTDEFKTRLGKGRKCYAFFHPLLPEVPLVYINVAFQPRISTSMKEITNVPEPNRLGEKEAKAVVFYSIVTTQPGLKGIDLPHQLIKRASLHIHQEYEWITEFSTLSPVPGFMPWLRSTFSSQQTPPLFDQKGWLRTLLPTKVKVVAQELGISLSKTPHQTLLDVLNNYRWYENDFVVTNLQLLMLRLCAHYIVTERSSKAPLKSMDRVAHFHLSNGAHVHSINWMADASPLRLSESATLMANYKYPHPTRALNAGVPSPYTKEGVIRVSSGVEALLQDRFFSLQQ